MSSKSSWLTGPLFVGDLLRRLGVGDEVRQHLVLHLDGADCVFCGRFVDGGNANDFIARPEDFRARLLNDLHRFDAGHLLGCAGIDAGDAGMRVGATQYLAGEQAVRDCSRRCTWLGRRLSLDHRPGRFSCRVAGRVAGSGHWYSLTTLSSYR